MLNWGTWAFSSISPLCAAIYSHWIHLLLATCWCLLTRSTSISAPNASVDLHIGALITLSLLPSHGNPCAHSYMLPRHPLCTHLCSARFPSASCPSANWFWICPEPHRSRPLFPLRASKPTWKVRMPPTKLHRRITCVSMYAFMCECQDLFIKRTICDT